MMAPVPRQALQTDEGDIKVDSRLDCALITALQ
jgi:hypothetical protein